MPIVANIIGPGHGNDKYLIHDQPGHVGYANFIKDTLNVGAIDGDSDHFVNVLSKVNHLGDIYNNQPDMYTLQSSIVPELKKKTASALRAWLSAVICCLIYGCDDENHTDIHIEGKVFKDRNDKTIKELQYLEIWKKKFDGSTGNSNDGTVACFGGAGVLEPDCDVNSFNYVTMDSDNPAYKVGYHNIVGTFHDQLFVVPLKEYGLDGVPGAIPAWKKKFLYLCGDNTNCDEYIDRLKSLNIKQMIFLHLGAESINREATISNPLKLVAGIIQNLLPLPGNISVAGLSLPIYKKINAIDFYKIDGVLNLDGMLSETLYLGRESDRKYRATYPLTKLGIDAIKAGSSISNFKMKVETDLNNDSLVKSAEVSFDLRTTMKFVIGPRVPVGAVVNDTYSFNYTLKRKYDAKNIKWIRGLPTFCMYPNLPSDLEDRCSKYTYVSRQGSIILLGRIEGLGKEENLENGLFLGSLNGDGNAQKLIDFSPSAHNPYANTQLYGDSTTFVSTTVASKPEHFIEVTNSLANCSMGYILNIRTVGVGDLPSLLEDRAPGVDISVAEYAPAAVPQTLNAYIDFGSSSSYVRYKIGNAGDYMPHLISENCTLRKCLIEYAQKQDYDSILNYPSENVDHKFLSNASVYDDKKPVNDYLPYHQAWMPIVKSFKEYPGIRNLSTSHKTDVAKAGDPATIPQVILNNILYTVACNAVNSHCDKVMLYPSLPSADYASSLISKWDMVIANIKGMFPNLQFANCLKKGSNHLLYESVAVSLGNAMPAANSLSINVDIGDGTTDMSAIYFDQNAAINFCGYSSIEYAGKDLIKTVIKDILVNGDAVAEKILIGALDPKHGAYGAPAFVPDSGSEDAYKGYILNMLRDWRREHNNDSFESKVMDILDISKLNSGAGANDQKIAANFVLRYMILMPVIKDFIHTAIKIAGTLPDGSKYNPSTTNIYIYFKGGASKGIDMIPVIDCRGNNSRNLMENYFKKEFEGEYAVSCNVTVSNDNDKQILVDGLSTVDATFADLTISGGQVNTVDWQMVIDPKYTGVFGKDDNVHKNALRIPFEVRYLPNTDPNIKEVDTLASQGSNNAIIKNVRAYYENTTNPFEELKKFYKDEIYGKLINNHDGVPDTIENLVMSFLDNASPVMVAAINKELGAMMNNSFTKAANSYIYPEMMKSAVFMFTLSKMLSKYHGSYRPDHTIAALGDTVNYQFGG